MSNYKFLLSKFSKNKFNKLPFFLIFCIVLGLLYLNFTVLEYENQKEIFLIQDNLKIREKEIPLLEEEMSKHSINSSSFKEKNNFLEQYKISEKSFKELLRNLEEENWLEYYKNKLNVENFNLYLFDDNPIVSVELKKNINYYEYNIKNNIDIIDQTYPTSGVSFAIYSWQEIIPILASIIIIYYLSQLLSEVYFENTNKTSVLPISKNKIKLYYLIFGIFLSIIFLLFVLGISFFLASYLCTPGNIREGYLIYDFVNNSFGWHSISKMMIEFLILQLLAFTLLCIIVVILGTYFKNNLSIMISSLSLTILPLMIIESFIPIHSYARFLPMTYFKVTNVVTGISSLNFDSNVSFSTGVVVLLVSIILLLPFLFKKDID